MEKSRSRLGAALTAVWVGLLAIYVWRSWAEVSLLGPNELGDMLAGAFGPVAFLWLVLGYLQQGEELRNSARALELQVVELRQSVEQQRLQAIASSAMADAATQQFQQQVQEAQRQAEAVHTSQQPVLSAACKLVVATDEEHSYEVVLTNHGAPCRVVTVLGKSSVLLVEAPRNKRVDVDGGYTFSVSFDPTLRPDSLLRVFYLDAGHRRQHFDFTFARVARRSLFGSEDLFTVLPQARWTDWLLIE